jgi:hypothetical protein
MLAIIDRALAREHLELAERHVAEGQLRVIAQLALVAKLERRGLKIKEANTLLHRLEETLALHVQHRDRIAQELREGV